jgi:hypothetical protein
MVTCGTGFGFGLGLGLGFGVGVALACPVGVADSALDVPGLLLAAGATAGVAVHAAARQTTAPATNINRMRDSIGTRCDETVKGACGRDARRAPLGTSPQQHTDPENMRVMTSGPAAPAVSADSAIRLGGVVALAGGR